MMIARRESQSRGQWLQQLALLRRRYLGPLLLALMLARLASILVVLTMLVPSFFDHSFPEGAVVARAVDVARGEIPYHDWRQWPHAFAPYGPLTYYSVGWLARLGAGGGVSEPLRFYILGRTISLFSLLGIGILIYALGRHWKLRRAWAGIAVSIFFSWVLLMHYAISYRPDAPMVFFSLLGLWIAMRGPARPVRILAALGCLYLAMWFKPAAWTVLIVLALRIRRECGWRRMAAWLAGFGAAALIPALLLNRHWDGRLFLNMIGSLNNGFGLALMADYWRQISLYRVVIPLGVIIAIPSLMRSRLGADKELLRILLISLGVSTLLGLKKGADLHYLIEPYALGSLVIVWWVGRLWRGEAQWPPVWREAFLWLLVIPLVVFKGVSLLDGIRNDLNQVRQSRVQPPYLETIRQTEGMILSTNPFIAVNSPGPPAALDHIQYRILQERGLLDDSALIDRIERREFTCIIIMTQDYLPKGPTNPDAKLLFCDRFLPAVRSNYRPIDRINLLTVLAPIQE